MSKTRALLTAAAMGMAVVSFQAGDAAAQVDKKAIAANYADMALAGFEDSLTTARLLQKAVRDLLAAPSAKTLAAAKQAWVAARVSYPQTEAFRFANPIVDAWEGKVNAWPLDEGLIDYVAADNPDSENPLFAANVVANTSLKINGVDTDASKITKKLLSETLHEAGGVEANVATGYHAIEFLLWGQDLNGTGPGAGMRPATDYDTKACTNGNCARRGAYLKAATDLLVDDMGYMTGQWGPDGAARKRQLGLPDDKFYVAIFSGLAGLSYGELAGERMKLGLLLHDPEEEHDCFSDNTHNSHYYDALGIENVYLGRYKRIDGSVVSGPSLADFVKSRAPNVDAELRKALATTVARMKALVDKAKAGTAYDQMIGEDNAADNRIVQAAIDGLLAQTISFRRAAETLSLKGMKVLGSDSLDKPGTIKVPAK